MTWQPTPPASRCSSEAGVGVLSEESGTTGPGRDLVVVDRPGRRLDQCVAGASRGTPPACARSTPTEPGRRWWSTRRRGCGSKRSGAGAPARTAWRSDRPGASGWASHRGVQRLSGPLLRLVAVPVPWGGRPRPVRGGRGRARRVRRGRWVASSGVGTTSAACWSAPRPVQCSAKHRDGTSSRLSHAERRAPFAAATPALLAEFLAAAAQ